MKQIPKFGLMRLNNGEHHQFHLSIYNLVNACSIFLTIPERSDLVHRYYEDHEAQGIAMNRERGSVNTQELQQADRKRNEYDSCFRLKIKSALLDYNPVNREAARRIMFILDKYGNVKQLPYAEKGGVMSVRFNELITNHIDDLNRIEATSILASMDSANQVFNSTFGTRSIVKINATRMNVQEARGVLDSDYLQIVLLLNSLAVVEPSPLYDTLIDKINYQIDYYRQQVANRYARLAAEKKEPPTPLTV